MTQLDAETQAMLDCLQKAVSQELERKRRLGQYAVVWRDGKVVCIGGAPDAQETDAADAPAIRGQQRAR